MQKSWKLRPVSMLIIPFRWLFQPPGWSYLLSPLSHLSLYSWEQCGRNRKLSYLNYLGGLPRITILSRIREKLNWRSAQITETVPPFSSSGHINKTNKYSWRKTIISHPSRWSRRAISGFWTWTTLSESEREGRGKGCHAQGTGGASGQGRTWKLLWHFFS